MAGALRRRLARVLRLVAERLDGGGPPRLLTVSAVAAARGVSRETVYRWIRAGRLRPAAYYRAGPDWAPLFYQLDAGRVGDRRQAAYRGT